MEILLREKIIKKDLTKLIVCSMIKITIIVIIIIFTIKFYRKREMNDERFKRHKNRS